MLNIGVFLLNVSFFLVRAFLKLNAVFNCVFAMLETRTKVYQSDKLYKGKHYDQMPGYSLVIDVYYGYLCKEKLIFPFAYL